MSYTTNVQKWPTFFVRITKDNTIDFFYYQKILIILNLKRTLGVFLLFYNVQRMIIQKLVHYVHFIYCRESPNRDDGASSVSWETKTSSGVGVGFSRLFWRLASWGT